MNRFNLPLRMMGLCICLVFVQFAEALAVGCATLRRASLRPPPIVDAERVELN